MRIIHLFAAFVAASSTAVAEGLVLPKFGPDATPIFQETDYLRRAPAPDYWTLSAFYVPQQTTSDCSAAAVAMAVNALRGQQQPAPRSCSATISATGSRTLGRR